ncbi:MAG: cation diffusion facilitator family transporter [Bacteroidales bacterium]|nr:cation diffusion facilitator family transporter [Bacteroidales bacterium]MDD4739168.1 cation diffusion facilitator family transporter [Bacteroidales bacterium]
MSKENSTKNIRTAFFLNLAFAFVELIGGIITNSVAILSDAVHDFGDSISLAIAWALQKKSNKAKDDKYSYGYKRFSLLSSVILSGILLVGSILILVEAIGRLFNPQEVNAQGMFWLSILGIIVNGLAALSVKRGKTLNERAVFLHIMEDVLGWIGVLVISIVMIFVNLPILDPILSISITIWVLYNVYKNLKATFNILLQAFPKNVDVKKLTKEIEAIDNVISIHDLHIWTQDGNSHVMTLHIVAEKNYETIKNKVREIANTFNIDHVTIELEGEESSCEVKLN